jgi:3-methylcrotonyl-CoA carboxylase beta subunit
MSTIDSNISTGSKAFKDNDASYRALLLELHRHRKNALTGGDAKAKNRHTSAGKLLPRDRVLSLLDAGSPFLEIATLAGGPTSGAAQLGAGIITGIGRVHGRLCMIIANDSTVKGGTYFGMTARKHVRAQKIAGRYRLPTITLVDSGGAYFPEMHGYFRTRVSTAPYFTKSSGSRPRASHRSRSCMALA